MLHYYSQRAGFGLTAICCVFLLTSCAKIGPEGSAFGKNRVNSAGVVQMFPEGLMERVDLAVLLGKPRLKDKERADYECDDGDATSDGCLKSAARLEEAFKQFTSSGKGAAERNAVQDRLIAASNQRCNVYKIYLKRTDSRTNFWLGLATTSLAGAGAIVTNVNSARVLAGLAGIGSGVRAEFRQAYMANLAVHVITKGIDNRRKSMHAAMLSKRGASADGLTGPSYTVQAAIADAIQYHGACSMIAGLEEAGDAVQEVANPGIEMMSKVMVMQRHLKEIGVVKSPDEFKWAGTPGMLAYSAANSTEIQPSSASFSIVQRKGQNIKAHVLTLMNSRIDALNDQKEGASDEVKEKITALVSKDDASIHKAIFQGNVDEDNIIYLDEITTAFNAKYKDFSAHQGQVLYFWNEIKNAQANGDMTAKLLVQKQNLIAFNLQLLSFGKSIDVQVVRIGNILAEIKPENSDFNFSGEIKKSYVTLLASINTNSDTLDLLFKKIAPSIPDKEAPAKQ